ncbi:MAG: TfoX/Sxy family protein [Opitutae bacterium]|nr:TfoX/Sxy family protein [Opitutae bacterium]
MPPAPALSALADRVSRHFAAKKIPTETRRMMGGVVFMVRGKMCVGVESHRLMARIGPDAEAAALKRAGCRPMNFTGRPMKGFVFVDAASLRTARQLGSWLDLALAFNPEARSARRARHG